MSTLGKMILVLGTVCALTGAAHANWAESFDNGDFDLATWQFESYPAMTGTFTQTIKAGADGNDYLALEETSSVGVGGSAFSAGFGSDADCYALLMNWEDGPANFRIELQKVVQLSHIMRTDFEVVVPNLANERSYYAELDIVGSGPVYVTGSLYEYKGGPLVARTPTMIDTNGNDAWEDEGEHDAVFTTGLSAISGYHEDPEPAGYYTTFDDVFAASDGPAAVVPSPANGATGVSILTDLSWTEAAFATGRQLWLGTPGNLQMVEPAPTGASCNPGMLELGTTYQWRVDQVGPSGVVTGHTWQFTTAACVPVETVESYANDDEIQAAWPHNIPPSAKGEVYKYVFVDTGQKTQGAKGMRFEYENQYEPFYTEATRTFDEPQDWTIKNVTTLALNFRGDNENVEQPLALRIEDATGNQVTVEHPLRYASQSEPWRLWDGIALADLTVAAESVDLTAVKKLTIRVGDGTPSGQEVEKRDTLYIDNIRLCP